MKWRNDVIVTNEQNFEHLMHHDIAQLWESRDKGTFIGVDDVTIRWISVTDPTHQQAVILVTGRNETFWKYREVIYELHCQGFDVYAHDHRGQGESDRLTADPEVGYVRDFDDYVEDLHRFMVGVVEPKGYQHKFMLAHSMGGTIGALFLAKYGQNFTSAVLNAPMFGLHMNKLEKFILKPLAFLVNSLQRQPSYLLGKNAYRVKPFEKNDQTQCALRYWWSKDIYVEYPKLKIGGASAHWVLQALKASKQCLQQAESIKTPVLLLQAEQDTIVDNKAQQQFCDQNALLKLHTVEEGYHELLLEMDTIRESTLQQTLAFFNQWKAPFLPK